MISFGSVLPFWELKSQQFELLVGLCLARERDWLEFEQRGLAGGHDGGADIRAVEKMANGRSRTWHVQCKSGHQGGLPNLKKAFDEALQLRPTPTAVLVAVGFDVRNRPVECHG